MLYYYIPYSRLQGLLQGGGPEFTHCLRELAEGEKMVELKCSHCGEFFITHYRPGSLGKPCPYCREKMARFEDEALAGVGVDGLEEQTRREGEVGKTGTR
ncbi:MAG: hypothetical protein HPY75_01725 [Actinobacteria bacterium]|nr:hypothetical protein [Actinomycetota bacterium]